MGAILGGTLAREIKDNNSGQKIKSLVILDPASRDPLKFNLFYDIDVNDNEESKFKNFKNTSEFTRCFVGLGSTPPWFWNFS